VCGRTHASGAGRKVDTERRGEVRHAFVKLLDAPHQLVEHHHHLLHRYHALGVKTTRSARSQIV
jgi:hypothetical protein